MRYRKILYKTMIILFLFAVAALDAAAAELPITSPFGWRVHPITGAWRFHTGIDLGYDYGTPIPATVMAIKSCSIIRLMIPTRATHTCSRSASPSIPSCRKGRS